ncbi:MAG TPA: hypothetical protein VJT31_34540, partial [Rugosimonospora sp.]|nr:hypothetical protein [Rugosimonospora sp.]
WATAHLPGAGLLRDGQKWIAWYALLAAPCCALAVESLTRRLADAGVRATVLVGFVLLPLALLPDLAWGGLGRLAPVRYPAEWSVVRDQLARDPHPGDVLVLPFTAFRRYAWNADRTVLDPAPRYLPRTVIVDDTLLVGPVQVKGEDPRATQARAALDAGQPLAPLGIGWVLVEHGTPGSLPERLLPTLITVHTGPWLTLYRVPGTIATARPATAPRAPVLAGDAAALALLLGAFLLRPRLLVGRLMSQTRKDGGDGADDPGFGRFGCGGRGPGADRGAGAGVHERAGREGGTGT